FSQNETRRMPNPLTQFPNDAEFATDQTATVARGKAIFSSAGCADCHRNGTAVNGVVQKIDCVVNATFQDYNIHEPGVVAEHTVDNDGVFLRLGSDYLNNPFGPPQDLGGRQNIASRNTKHLRAFWDSVPRWLHHGGAHTIREVLLASDSPLLQPGERGFNFRTVRTDSMRRVA